MANVKAACAQCYGPNVTRAGSAKWDVDKQEWVLFNAWAAYCRDCDEEVDLEFITII
jgi:hypothetical protein